MEPTNFVQVFVMKMFGTFLYVVIYIYIQLKKRCEFNSTINAHSPDCMKERFTSNLLAKLCLHCENSCHMACGCFWETPKIIAIMICKKHAGRHRHELHVFGNPHTLTPAVRACMHTTPRWLSHDRLWRRILAQVLCLLLDHKKQFHTHSFAPFWLGLKWFTRAGEGPTRVVVLIPPSQSTFLATS